MTKEELLKYVEEVFTTKHEDNSNVMAKSTLSILKDDQGLFAVQIFGLNGLTLTGREGGKNFVRRLSMTPQELAIWYDFEINKEPIDALVFLSTLFGEEFQVNINIIE